MSTNKKLSFNTYNTCVFILTSFITLMIIDLGIFIYYIRTKLSKLTSDLIVESILDGFSINSPLENTVDNIYGILIVVLSLQIMSMICY